jgi:arsenite-transporting ATPase
VLLLGADPAGSVADLLGQPVGAEPVAVRPGLRAAQIDPGAALADWRATLPPQLEPLLGRIGIAGSSLDRAVLHSIWEATPPGLDELVALSELLDLAGEDETVIVDSAPTGHFLRLLELPELALEWTRALMRLLLEYGLAGELDALTKRVLAFARHLKSLRSRLADAGWTGTVIVTIAEPVVEAETERLANRLGQAGVPIAAVLTNLHTQRYAQLPLAVPRLVAPVCVPPPHGFDALRSFVGCWELV